MDRILVPTDGSEAGARALTIAERIARAQNAELLLVRVIEPIPAALSADAGDLPLETYDEFTRAIEQEVEAAMSRLANEVASTAPRVRTAVLKGPVDIALLDYEARERPDLVVMSSHGRTGLARFALGSITDRLLREGTAPVLVLRRTSDASTELTRALLMLDGSSVAEEALPIAAELLGKPITSLVLYRAVAHEQDRVAAMTYLNGVAGRVAREGIEVSCKVDVGEPRDVIEGAASDVDLVILCSHGRSGFDRLRHGSVAEFVMRHVDRPALLARAGMRAKDPS